jgi:hypothetical protein
MDPAQGLQLSAGIASFGNAISSLEHLAKLKQFSAGGIYSPLLHIESKLGRGKLGAFLQSVGLLVAMLSVRLVAAIIVLVATFAWPREISIVPLWTLAASSVWVAWRRRVGGDGGEQMTTMVLIASSIGLTFSLTPSVQCVAAFFIAMQSCLAYFSAGMAKLLSSVWRSGDALRCIVNTSTHGSQWLVELLTRYPRFSAMVNWGLILAELAFPAVLIAPRGGACFFLLGVGLLFHVSNAVVMGLNNFIWAFLATYPCIYFLWEVIHG